MKLPLLLALTALLAGAATGQTQSPSVDDEGSSGDINDDGDDRYSGSGSGYFEITIRPTSVGVSFTTEEPFLFSTTQATSPAPSASPAAEPSPSPEDVTITPLPTEVDGESGAFWDKEKEREMAERERERQMEKERQREMQREREREQLREMERQRERELEREKERERIRAAAQTTVAPRYPGVLPVVTSSPTAGPGESTVPSAGSDDLTSFTNEEEDFSLPTESTSTSYDPGFDIESTTDEDTRTTTEATPEPMTAAPTVRAWVSFRPRVPITTATKAAPTERTMRPQQPTTTQEGTNEVGAVGPSGDFEIREENRNNVDGERPADPDLIGNTVDGSSSAAQLPQKNILERKEVLIAVIVGGVVGALFAAFLVMLLVYRMKKKDEGSYTLEEPKQATVTYQKPDKQEEFYA
uniref:Syndecan n=1 Tax=Oryzias sinensis TaxID=183150 RepID=A0A8C7YPW6_9TELE